MADILFKTDDYIFSYRVGGVLIHNGKVLMQNAEGDDGYAFIGGHVALEKQPMKPLCESSRRKSVLTSISRDCSW